MREEEMKEPTRWRMGMRLGVTALLATAALTAIPATFTPPALRSVAYAEEVASASDDLGTEIAGGRIAGAVEYKLYLRSDNSYCLQILGLGSMLDYDMTGSKPWDSYLTGATRTSLETIIIEEGVTEIGNNAFINFSGLKTVEIADTVERIGENAFSGCTNLSDYTLPKNLKRIEAGAFKDTKQLEDLTIPEGIEYIGEKALVAPSRLLKFGDTLPTMPKDPSTGNYTSLIGTSKVIDLSHVQKTITTAEMKSTHVWSDRYVSYIVGGNYEGGISTGHTGNFSWGYPIDLGATDVTYELTSYGSSSWKSYRVTSVKRSGNDLKAIYSQYDYDGGSDNGYYRRPTSFNDLVEFKLTAEDSLNYSVTHGCMTYVTWSKYYNLEDYRGDKPKTEWTTPTPPTTDDTFTGWFKDPGLRNPVKPDETTGKVYAGFQPKSAFFTFLGGSLRMDETDPTVSTHIRFGYRINTYVDGCSVDTSGKTGWIYGWTNASGAVYQGELFPERLNLAYAGNDVYYTTNLVITNVPVSHYATSISSQFVLTYTTKSGEEFTLKSPGEKRSVKQVATAVRDNTSAPSTQVEYCKKILATLN